MRINEFDVYLVDIGVIAKYKIPSYVKLIYYLLVKNIVLNEGYNSDFLNLPIEEDSEFLVRGLILDYVHGNVLRLGAGGYIVAASHGSIALEEEEIDRIYPGRRWNAVDELFSDFFNIVRGHLSNKLMVLLGYFEIAVGLAFIRIVDTIDCITHVNVKNYLFAYDSIASAVYQVLDESDGYLATLNKNPDDFLYECDETTVNWLMSLRKSHKYLILFSEWNFYNTKNTLKFILGSQWNKIFNFIICEHNKISFFVKTKKFKRLYAHKNCKGRSIFYVDGCWKLMNKFIQGTIKKTHPKVLSFGSDLLLDSFLQSSYFEATHILICEELKAETPVGLEYGAPFDKILTSEMWGSYFRYDDYHMLWSILIRRYSTYVTAGIDNIASHALDEELPVVPF